MNTSARPTTTEASHYYLPDGTPFYEVPYADPKKGMRKATLADARKVNALPSVTTVLRVLDKPALTTWLIEQACLAVLTTPRGEHEFLDAFVDRVLHQEKQQEQEAQKARDLGTDIHAGMEAALKGEQVSEEIAPYIRGAVEALKPYGQVVATERVIVGNGYAGRTDLITRTPACDWIWDFKTTKKLPKTAYAEHRLQLSAYARAWVYTEQVRTANLYLSTAEPGGFVICEHEDWHREYANGFLPALTLWRHLNNYSPNS